MQHPVYSEVNSDEESDVFPAVFPARILPVLQSVFSKSFTSTPNWKNSRFLIGFFVMCIRKFLFGMTLNDRIPKKLKQLLFQRIIQNVKLGNFGRDYVKNGGIFKICAIEYQKIRRISPDKISRASAKVLYSCRTPQINLFVDTVFTTALCPKRGVSVHEMKLMIYLLRRICESLLVDFRIDQNYFDFTDSCYDCYRSECPDNDFSGYPRRLCFEMLAKILEKLDMFEQQHSWYPSMEVLFGRHLK